MSNTTVTIAGREYVYQGVTDLEVAPLAEIFGTERPEEGTKEYRDWERQFMRKFADYSSQRAIAFFLLCAFPNLPESIVKYTVRRMPDGTEECKPGRDLRVRLEAKDFEQIVLIISDELKKIQKKSSQERNSRRESISSNAIKAVTTKRPKPAHFILDEVDTDKEESSSVQQFDPHEIAKVVEAVLDRRQYQRDKSDFFSGRIETRTKQPDDIDRLKNRADTIIKK